MFKRRATSAEGFTLIELLVVISILGTLAAIAIPSFIGHRGRAQDTASKENVRLAAITIESHQTDEQTYDVTSAELIATEPALNAARNLAVTGTRDTYTVSVSSMPGENGGTFTMQRAANGRVLRLCSNHGKGACHRSADASGNWW